jgi:hypothetical protein
VDEAPRGAAGENGRRVSGAPGGGAREEGGGQGRELLRPPPPGDPFAPGGEDEPPGSYLAELGAGAANIAWGLVNLVLVVGVGAIALAIGIPPGSPWRPLARLVWSLLPLSAIILAIVTLWQGGNAYANPAPGKAAGSFALAAGSLALWLVLRFALGVLPPS